MRDDVSINLVDEATSDPEFRNGMRRDQERTLRAYGYDLTPEELAAVEEFQASTAGMSDAEIDEMLAGGASRRQFGG